MAAIAAARAGGGKVLLHCANGVSRSAAVAAAALVALEGLDPSSAWAAVKVDPRVGDGRFLFSLIPHCRLPSIPQSYLDIRGEAE